jgi:positive regulator of sigma E activity
MFTILLIIIIILAIASLEFLVFRDYKRRQSKQEASDQDIYSNRNP